MKLWILIFLFVFRTVCALDLQREFEYIKMKHSGSFKQIQNFTATDLYGKNFNLSEHAGKVIILTFGDKRALLERSIFHDYRILKNIDPGKTVMVNVYYPGGIFFAVPRPEVVKKMRARIDSVKLKIKEDVSSDDADFYDKINMHWIVDWHRKITRLYDVPRHQIYVLIVDKKGNIREEIFRQEDENFLRVNSKQKDRFTRCLQKLYAEING